MFILSSDLIGGNYSVCQTNAHSSDLIAGKQSVNPAVISKIYSLVSSLCQTNAHSSGLIADK